MNTAQRCSVLVIALILLHLAAFSQEKKYVKKNLVWQPKAIKAVPSAQPSPSTLPLNPTPTSTPYLWVFQSREGFFCRQEYKLEKWTGMPIKFRLGTYELAHKQEYGK